MKILLVDDNLMDRTFVAQSLRQVQGFAYELVFSDSLAQTLQQLDAATFDVILLDLWLPDSEGLETCHRVVAAAPHTPVVVMTATDDPVLATDAIRSGAQDYLVKGAFPGSAIMRVLQYAIYRFDSHRELNFARVVQAALLPAEHPRLEGFDIFGGSYPAKQTCGDWFDYLWFADGSLGLVVGDVSGKGFGPAILSAMIAAYLRVLIESRSEIQDILNICNRMICKRRIGDNFAVLSLGQLQAGVPSLTYGGAGEGILIVSRTGELKHQVSASGIPLGGDETFRYQQSTQASLEPGDILLILTDGFREAWNRKAESFGDARVVETVAANAGASAKAIFVALWSAAREFADGLQQQDDMTGIVIKVRDA